MRTAIEAADILMHYYRNGYQKVDKADGSPVTNADVASSKHIRKQLEQTGIPVIDEESEQLPVDVRLSWPENWCVDPLDGTKEFIAANDEFAINIALIREQKPVFGVIASPVEQVLIAGSPDHGCVLVPFDQINHPEAWLPVENGSAPALTLITSRSHHSGSTLKFINTLKERYGAMEVLQKGSALKFFDLAQAKAHVYPRFAPTMEWDIAAGQAILESVGGQVVHAVSGEPLRYNKANLKNPYFVAYAATFSEFSGL